MPCERLMLDMLKLKGNDGSTLGLLGFGGPLFSVLEAKKVFAAQGSKNRFDFSLKVEHHSSVSLPTARSISGTSLVEVSA